MSDRSVKFVHMVARATPDPDGRLEYIGAVQDVDAAAAFRGCPDQSADAAGTRHQGHESRSTDRIDCPRGQPAARRYRHQRQHLPQNAGRRSAGHRWGHATPHGARSATEIARPTLSRDCARSSGKEHIKTARLDLNDATREVIALSLSELQRNRVVLRAELAEDLPPVIGDRVQLQQVILNLLLNASDAMRGVHNRERRLVVSTQRDEGLVRLSVKDVGIGLEFPIAEKLFEPFCSTREHRDGCRSVCQSLHHREP